jgi:hypothetical protein
MTSICPISTIYYIFHYIAAKKQIKKEELTNSKFIPTFMFCLPMHENGKFFNPKLYCKGFIK